MKKKLALSIAAAAMIGTLAVGGTLAWFTDVETATNVVTVGNVDIKLSETGEGEGITGGTGLDYDVMPGKVYDKTVTIGNVGNDAYVRAIITVSGSEVITDGLLSDAEDAISFGALDENAEWKANKDGSVSCTVNYDGIFAEGTKDPWTLFTNFNIPSSWGNQYENAEFNIMVEAQAIQVDNISADQAWAEFANVTNPDANKPVDETGTVTAQ